jgi:glycosyltransferase involved in cell wall biosynthesis
MLFSGGDDGPSWGGTKTKMKILINATSARVGGGITVLRNLLQGLASTDGGCHEYIVFGREDVREQLDTGTERVRFATSRLGGGSTLGRLLWEQIELPARAMLASADVVFAPGGIAMLACPRPQVVMFQNAAPYDPDFVGRATRENQRRLRLLRHVGRISAHLARRVIFISEFQRNLILPQLGIPLSKASTVYLGRDPIFRPSVQAEARALTSRLGVSRPYLLSVSQFYRYKNFVELVIGFARARHSLPPEVQLVIAGAECEAEYAELVRRTIAREGIGDQVRIIGHVPYTDLPALYAGAELFIFPSTCESFPNIFIEAMASGTPTLSSNRASMRELGRDGAVYFDPFEPDEIAAQIVRLWHDARSRQELREKGIAVCQRYHWNETARATLKVFEEVL